VTAVGVRRKKKKKKKTPKKKRGEEKPMSIHRVERAAFVRFDAQKKEKEGGGEAEARSRWSRPRAEGRREKGKA